MKLKMVPATILFLVFLLPDVLGGRTFHVNYECGKSGTITTLFSISGPECEHQCVLDSSCQAVSIQHDTCSLFSKCSLSEKVGAITVFPKDASTPTGFIRQEGRKCTKAKNLASFKASSAVHCVPKCRARKDCVNFHYYGGKCYLKGLCECAGKAAGDAGKLYVKADPSGYKKDGDKRHIVVVFNGDRHTANKDVHDLTRKIFDAIPKHFEIAPDKVHLSTVVLSSPGSPAEFQADDMPGVGRLSGQVPSRFPNTPHKSGLAAVLGGVERRIDAEIQQRPLVPHTVVLVTRKPKNGYPAPQMRLPALLDRIKSMPNTNVKVYDVGGNDGNRQKFFPVGTYIPIPASGGNGPKSPKHVPDAMAEIPRPDRPPMRVTGMIPQVNVAADRNKNKPKRVLNGIDGPSCETDCVFDPSCVAANVKGSSCEIFNKFSPKEEPGTILFTKPKPDMTPLGKGRGYLQQPNRTCKKAGVLKTVKGTPAACASQCDANKACKFFTRKGGSCQLLKDCKCPIAAKGSTLFSASPDRKNGDGKDIIIGFGTGISAVLDHAKGIVERIPRVHEVVEGKTKMYVVYKIPGAKAVTLSPVGALARPEAMVGKVKGLPVKKSNEDPVPALVGAIKGAIAAAKKARPNVPKYVAIIVPQDGSSPHKISGGANPLKTHPDVNKVNVFPVGVKSGPRLVLPTVTPFAIVPVQTKEVPRSVWEIPYLSPRDRRPKQIIIGFGLNVPDVVDHAKKVVGRLPLLHWISPEMTRVVVLPKAPGKNPSVVATVDVPFFPTLLGKLKGVVPKGSPKEDPVKGLVASVKSILKNPKYTRPGIPNYVALIVAQNPKKPTATVPGAAPLKKEPIKKLTIVPVGTKTVPAIKKAIIPGLVPEVVFPVQKAKIPDTAFEITDMPIDMTPKDIIVGFGTNDKEVLAAGKALVGGIPERHSVSASKTRVFVLSKSPKAKVPSLLYSGKTPAATFVGKVNKIPLQAAAVDPLPSLVGQVLAVLKDKRVRPKVPKYVVLFYKQNPKLNPATVPSVITGKVSKPPVRKVTAVPVGGKNIPSVLVPGVAVPTEVVPIPGIWTPVRATPVITVVPTSPKPQHIIIGFGAGVPDVVQAAKDVIANLPNKFTVDPLYTRVTVLVKPAKKPVAALSTMEPKSLPAILGSIKPGGGREDAMPGLVAAVDDILVKKPKWFRPGVPKFVTFFVPQDPKDPNRVPVEVQLSARDPIAKVTAVPVGGKVGKPSVLVGTAVPVEVVPVTKPTAPAVVTPKITEIPKDPNRKHIIISFGLSDPKIVAVAKKIIAELPKLHHIHKDKTRVTILAKAPGLGSKAIPKALKSLNFKTPDALVAGANNLKPDTSRKEDPLAALSDYIKKIVVDPKQGFLPKVPIYVNYITRDDVPEGRIPGKLVDSKWLFNPITKVTVTNVGDKPKKPVFVPGITPAEVLPFGGIRGPAAVVPKITTIPTVSGRINVVVAFGTGNPAVVKAAKQLIGEIPFRYAPIRPENVRVTILYKPPKKPVKPIFSVPGSIGGLIDKVGKIPAGKPSNEDAITPLVDKFKELTGKDKKNFPENIPQYLVVLTPQNPKAPLSAPPLNLPEEVTTPLRLGTVMLVGPKVVPDKDNVDIIMIPGLIPVQIIPIATPLVPKAVGAIAAPTRPWRNLNLVIGFGLGNPGVVDAAKKLIAELPKRYTSAFPKFDTVKVTVIYKDPRGIKVLRTPDMSNKMKLVNTVNGIRPASSKENPEPAIIAKLKSIIADTKKFDPRERIYFTLIRPQDSKNPTAKPALPINNDIDGRVDKINVINVGTKRVPVVFLPALAPTLIMTVTPVKAPDTASALIGLPKDGRRLHVVIGFSRGDPPSKPVVQAIVKYLKDKFIVHPDYARFTVIAVAPGSKPKVDVLSTAQLPYTTFKQKIGAIRPTGKSTRDVIPAVGAKLKALLGDKKLFRPGVPKYLVHVRPQNARDPSSIPRLVFPLDGRSPVDKITVVNAGPKTVPSGLINGLVPLHIIPTGANRVPRILNVIASTPSATIEPKHFVIGVTLGDKPSVDSVIPTVDAIMNKYPVDNVNTRITLIAVKPASKGKASITVASTTPNLARFVPTVKKLAKPSKPSKVDPIPFVEKKLKALLKNPKTFVPKVPVYLLHIVPQDPKDPTKLPVKIGFPLDNTSPITKITVLNVGPINGPSKLINGLVPLESASLSPIRAPLIANVIDAVPMDKNDPKHIIVAFPSNDKPTVETAKKIIKNLPNLHSVTPENTRITVIFKKPNKDPEVITTALTPNVPEFLKSVDAIPVTPGKDRGKPLDAVKKTIDKLKNDPRIIRPNVPRSLTYVQPKPTKPTEVPTLGWPLNIRNPFDKITIVNVVPKKVIPAKLIVGVIPIHVIPATVLVAPLIANVVASVPTDKKPKHFVIAFRTDDPELVEAAKKIAKDIPKKHLVHPDFTRITFLAQDPSKSSPEVVPSLAFTPKTKKTYDDLVNKIGGLKGKPAKKDVTPLLIKKFGELVKDPKKFRPKVPKHFVLLTKQNPKAPTTAPPLTLSPGRVTGATIVPVGQISVPSTIIPSAVPTKVIPTSVGRIPVVVSAIPIVPKATTNNDPKHIVVGFPLYNPVLVKAAKDIIAKLPKLHTIDPARTRVTVFAKKPKNKNPVVLSTTTLKLPDFLKKVKGLKPSGKSKEPHVGDIINAFKKLAKDPKKFRPNVKSFVTILIDQNPKDPTYVAPVVPVLPTYPVTTADVVNLVPVGTATKPPTVEPNTIPIRVLPTNPKKIPDIVPTLTEPLPKVDDRKHLVFTVGTGEGKPPVDALKKVVSELPEKYNINKDKVRVTVIYKRPGKNPTSFTSVPNGAADLINKVKRIPVDKPSKEDPVPALTKHFENLAKNPSQFPPAVPITVTHFKKQDPKSPESAKPLPIPPKPTLPVIKVTIVPAGKKTVPGVVLPGLIPQQVTPIDPGVAERLPSVVGEVPRQHKSQHVVIMTTTGDKPTLDGAKKIIQEMPKKNIVSPTNTRLTFIVSTGKGTPKIVHSTSFPSPAGFIDAVNKIKPAGRPGNFIPVVQKEFDKQSKNKKVFRTGVPVYVTIVKPQDKKNPIFVEPIPGQPGDLTSPVNKVNVILVGAKTVVPIRIPGVTPTEITPIGGILIPWVVYPLTRLPVDRDSRHIVVAFSTEKKNVVEAAKKLIEEIPNNYLVSPENTRITVIPLTPGKKPRRIDSAKDPDAKKIISAVKNIKPTPKNKGNPTPAIMKSLTEGLKDKKNFRPGVKVYLTLLTAQKPKKPGSVDPLTAVPTDVTSPLEQVVVVPVGPVVAPITVEPDVVPTVIIPTSPVTLPRVPGGLTSVPKDNKPKHLVLLFPTNDPTTLNAAKKVIEELPRQHVVSPGNTRITVVYKKGKDIKVIKSYDTPDPRDLLDAVKKIPNTSGRESDPQAPLEKKLTDLLKNKKDFLPKVPITATFFRPQVPKAPFVSPSPTILPTQDPSSPVDQITFINVGKEKKPPIVKPGLPPVVIQPITLPDAPRLVPLLSNVPKDKKQQHIVVGVSTGLPELLDAAKKLVEEIPKKYHVHPDKTRVTVIVKPNGGKPVPIKSTDFKTPEEFLDKVKKVPVSKKGDDKTAPKEILKTLGGLLKNPKVFKPKVPVYVTLLTPQFKAKPYTAPVITVPSGPIGVIVIPVGEGDKPIRAIPGKPPKRIIPTRPENVPTLIGILTEKPTVGTVPTKHVIVGVGADPTSVKALPKIVAEIVKRPDVKKGTTRVTIVYKPVGKKPKYISTLDVPANKLVGKVKPAVKPNNKADKNVIPELLKTVDDLGKNPLYTPKGVPVLVTLIVPDTKKMPKDIPKPVIDAAKKPPIVGITLLIISPKPIKPYVPPLNIPVQVVLVSESKIPVTIVIIFTIPRPVPVPSPVEEHDVITVDLRDPLVVKVAPLLVDQVLKKKKPQIDKGTARVTVVTVPGNKRPVKKLSTKDKKPADILNELKKLKPTGGKDPIKTAVDTVNNLIRTGEKAPKKTPTRITVVRPTPDDPFSVDGKVNELKRIPNVDGVTVVNVGSIVAPPTVVPGTGVVVVPVTTETITVVVPIILNPRAVKPIKVVKPERHIIITFGLGDPEVVKAVPLLVRDVFKRPAIKTGKTQVSIVVKQPGKVPSILTTNDLRPPDLEKAIKNLKPTPSAEDPSPALVDKIQKEFKKPTATSEFPKKVPTFIIALVSQDKSVPKKFSPKLSELPKIPDVKGVTVVPVGKKSEPVIVVPQGPTRVAPTTPVRVKPIVILVTSPVFPPQPPPVVPEKQIIIGFGTGDKDVVDAAKKIIPALVNKPDVKTDKTRVTVVVVDKNGKPKAVITTKNTKPKDVIANVKKIAPTPSKKDTSGPLAKEIEKVAKDPKISHPKPGSFVNVLLPADPYDIKSVPQPIEDLSKKRPPINSVTVGNVGPITTPVYVDPEYPWVQVLPVTLIEITILVPYVTVFPGKPPAKKQPKKHVIVTYPNWDPAVTSVVPKAIADILKKPEVKKGDTIVTVLVKNPKWEPIGVSTKDTKPENIPRILRDLTKPKGKDSPKESATKLVDAVKKTVAKLPTLPTVVKAFEPQNPKNPSAIDPSWPTLTKVPAIKHVGVVTVGTKTVKPVKPTKNVDVFPVTTTTIQTVWIYIIMTTAPNVPTGPGPFTRPTVVYPSFPLMRIVDLVFLLDGTTAGSPQDFKVALDLVKVFTKYNYLDPRLTRVTVIYVNGKQPVIYRSWNPRHPTKMDHNVIKTLYSKLGNLKYPAKPKKGDGFATLISQLPKLLKNKFLRPDNLYIYAVGSKYGTGSTKPLITPLNAWKKAKVNFRVVLINTGKAQFKPVKDSVGAAYVALYDIGTGKGRVALSMVYGYIFMYIYAIPTDVYTIMGACPKGSDLINGACYGQCPQGYNRHAKKPEMCYGTCSSAGSGYTKIGNTCWSACSPGFVRNPKDPSQCLGRPIMILGKPTCPKGFKYEGGFCWLFRELPSIKCPEGLERIGHCCVGKCPPGSTQEGKYCFIPLGCPAGTERVGDMCRIVACPNGASWTQSGCKGGEPAVVCSGGTKLQVVDGRYVCVATKLVCPDGRKSLSHNGKTHCVKPCPDKTMPIVKDGTLVCKCWNGKWMDVVRKFNKKIGVCDCPKGQTRKILPTGYRCLRKIQTQQTQKITYTTLQRCTGKMIKSRFGGGQTCAPVCKDGTVAREIIKGKFACKCPGGYYPRIIGEDMMCKCPDGSWPKLQQGKAACGMTITTATAKCNKGTKLVKNKAGQSICLPPCPDGSLPSEVDGQYVCGTQKTMTMTRTTVTTTNSNCKSGEETYLEDPKTKKPRCYANCKVKGETHVNFKGEILCGVQSCPANFFQMKKGVRVVCEARCKGKDAGKLWLIVGGKPGCYPDCKGKSYTYNAKKEIVCAP